MAVNETTLIDAGIQVGLLNADTVSKLRLQAKREKLHLIEVVTRAGRFPAAALYQALAEIRDIPYLQPSQLKADRETIALLPRSSFQQRLMLPVHDSDGSKLLAVADPDDRLSLERVERATGISWQPAIADPVALETAIARMRESFGGAPAAKDSAPEDDPVIMFDSIMKEVYLRRASDIHFEPREDGMRIRLRVDGEMQEYRRSLNMEDEESLVNRIKVLAGLDISEQRMPQDGAMKYSIIDWDIPETNIRVATIPTRWGERVTMRILGEETGQLSLEQLGMPRDMLSEFRQAITNPHGMILVTGPTGSGKSTTLYAALRELRVDEMNILTVEDPVEQTIEGISQVQVGVKIDFARALRSFLRHDPDVILVGEIRDRETVDIGLRAAMTGHLVMSTLHTNDSPGAITRLADIGAERFLIGSTLTGVLAQRLTRKLCSRCKQKRPARPDELEILECVEEDKIEVFDPVGCSFCLGSGFRGRIGIFEALWINRELRHAIADGAGEMEIAKSALNFRTLWQDCRRKVINGDVPLSEVHHLRPEI